MLEIVEQEEHRLAGEVRDERLLERLPGFLADRERLRERGEDELGIAKRREWHPEDAVGEGLGGRGRRLQGEAGLAGPSRSREREQG